MFRPASSAPMYLNVLLACDDKTPQLFSFYHLLSWYFNSEIFPSLELVSSMYAQQHLQSVCFAKPGLLWLPANISEMSARCLHLWPSGWFNALDTGERLSAGFGSPPQCGISLVFLLNFNALWISAFVSESLTEQNHFLLCISISLLPLPVYTTSLLSPQVS